MDKTAKVKNNLQQWVQMPTNTQNTGIIVVQWCEHEQISKYVYYYRLSKVRESICEQIAMPVAEIPVTVTGSVMTISFNGIIEEIGNAVSVAVIRTLKFDWYSRQLSVYIVTGYNKLGGNISIVRC